MSTTASEVFTYAMALTDSLAGGSARNGRTENDEARTIPILNALLPRLYQYSDTRTAAASARPVPTKLASLTDTLAIDDGLARAVLPFGLAAHLMAGYDPVQSNLWFQRYEEELNAFRNVPSVFGDIGDLYGVRTDGDTEV